VIRLPTAAAAVLAVCIHPVFAQTGAEAMRAEALALARGGRLDEARQTLLRARAQFPADKRFRIDLAGVAFRLGDRSAARSYVRQALRIDPADPYANDFAATLYLLDGNLDAAVKYWNRVSKPALRAVRVPDDPGVDPGLLRKLLPRPEAPFLTSSGLRAARTGIERLGVFGAYKLELAPAEGEAFDLHLAASAAELHGGLAGRALPYLRGLPFQTLHVDFLNMRASAIHFTSMWRWDPHKRRGLMALRGPVPADPRWRLGLALDMRGENWDTGTPFSMRRDDIAFEIGRTLTDSLALGMETHFTGRRFAGAAEGALFEDASSLKQVSRLSWHAVDLPEHGFGVRASATGELGRVLGRSGFAKARADAAARWQPGAGRWRLDARALAGKTAGAVPFDELFVLGMERDHDLWLRGHAATRDGRKGASPLARDYLVVQTGTVRNLWRHPLFRIGAGPFLDTGRGWDSTGQFGSRRWLLDAGAQLEVGVLSGLTVSFIYGRKLRQGGGAFYTAVSR
jgi:hypothetical protein